MTDLQAIVDNQLTKLTSVANNAYVDSGIVALFPDPTFAYGRQDLNIHDKQPGERHTVPPASTDNTTWVAWNLPVGVVVTLTDHYRALNTSSSVGFLEGLGGSVDLVGTGRTESADLRECGCNDMVYGWFWREVDLRYGAVEMFCDPNFTGIRQTIFLSEWAPGVRHSLVGTHMNDNMTSIRWRSLQDKQRVKFWEHPQGDCTSFSDARGWGSIKENGDLRNSNFNDVVSSFRWDPVLPKEEKILPIEINAPRENSQAIQASESYTNNSGVSQKFTVTWSASKTETITVATTQTHVAGVKANMTQKLKGGVPGVGEAEVSYGLEVSYQYTNSKTDTKSVGDTVTMTYAREVTAPPGGTTVATMSIDYGKMPQQTYNTQAIRWYDEPVAGAVRDDSKNGWYRREETTQIIVSGGLASKFSTRADFKPFS